MRGLDYASSTGGHTPSVICMRPRRNPGQGKSPSRGNTCFARSGSSGESKSRFTSNVNVLAIPGVLIWQLAMYLQNPGYACRSDVVCNQDCAGLSPSRHSGLDPESSRRAGWIPALPRLWGRHSCLPCARSGQPQGLPLPFFSPRPWNGRCPFPDKSHQAISY